MNECVISSCQLTELLNGWQKSLKLLRYDKPLTQLTIIRAIDSTYVRWNFSWATRELFICECMMNEGGNGKTEEKKEKETWVSFQISWSVNQQDFFFQHDNKSLLLLHFWLLMWSDFYLMLYEFRIELAIFLFYFVFLWS